MKFIRIGVMLAAVLAGAPALAQAPSDEAEPRTASRLGVQGTYGMAAEINGSVDIDVGTLGVRWTRLLGGARVLGGEPAWGLELVAFGFDQDPTALGGGAHLFYEHRLAPGARVRPLLVLGAGALVTGDRVPPGETHYNFSLFVGPAIEIALSDRTWLTAGYRLQHVSNADTGVRNLGINAHAIVLGVSWGAGR